MQHAVKSKVLAAVLSVMIAITFMPWYLWQTSDAVHAATKSVTVVVGNTETVDIGTATSYSTDPLDISSYATVAPDYGNDKLSIKGEGAGTFTISANADTINVEVKAAVAYNASKTDGQRYYASLEDAIKKAADSDTVKLVNDATLSQDITVDKNLNIDLYGNNLKSDDLEEARTISAASKRHINIEAANNDFTNINKAKIVLKTNTGGSIIVRHYSGTPKQESKTDNEYIATYVNNTLGNSLYLGLRAFEQAYTEQANLKPDNFNYPIRIYNTENLKNVPEGTILRNEDVAKKFTVNDDPVLIATGNFYQVSPTDQWKVIFDAQGGTLENGLETEARYAKKNQNERVDALTPTKEGYIFDGWYTSRTVKYVFEDETDSHQKTVEVDGDKVNVYQASEGLYTIVTANGRVIQGATLVKDNLYDFSKPVEDNMTLYAHWYRDLSTVEFTVDFDLAGGTDEAEEGEITTADQTVKFGEKVNKPVAPTRDGYTFDGWYNGEDEWNFNTNRVFSDMTLTAQWTAEPTQAEDNVYAVKFDLNGGKYAEVNSERKAQLFQGAVWAAIMAKDEQALSYAIELAGDEHAEAITAFVNGYTGSKLDRSATKIQRHINNLIEENNITFTDGKIYSDENFYQIIEEGSLVEEPNKKNLSKDDSTFVMWIDKATGEEFEFNGTFIDKETTLVAQWKTNQYTVEFKTQGHGQGVDPIKVDKGAYIGTEPVLEEDGYIFGGWFADQACRGTKLNLKNVKPEDLSDNASEKDPYTVHLYAKWTKANTYTVEFKTQGHGQGVDPVKVAEGAYIGAEPVLEEDGYIFGGWFADQACRGTKLNLKNVKPESLDKDTKDDNYTVQLYAKWTQAECNVHFDFNGGKIVVPAEGEKAAQEITDINKSVAKNSKVNDPGDPEKKGYKFLGWFKKGSAVAFDFNEETITADTTLTAKWEEKCVVTIYYDDTNDMKVLAQVYVEPGHIINDGEEAEDTFDVELFKTRGAEFIKGMEEAMTKLKPGYTFMGFYTKDGEEFDLGTKIYHNTPIYGHWAQNVYEVSFNLNAKEIVNGDAADGKIETQIVEEGKLPTEPVTPIYKQNDKEMFIFGGWYSDPNLKTEYKFDTPFTGDVVLYAKWIPAKKSVVFYDATGDEAVPVAVMEPNQGTNFKYSELYGVGKTPQSLNDILLTEGYTAMSNKMYAKTGYEFINFYTDPACEKVWKWNDEDEGSIDKNASIYLKYDPIQYKIVFDRGAENATAKEGEALNGALNYDWASGQKTYTQQVAYGTENQLIPCKYEREGFLFNGWKLYHIGTHKAFGIKTYVDEALINANIDETQNNVIGTPEDLYLEGEYANYIFVAQWTPVKYVVNYDANGGTGEMKADVLTYNNETSENVGEGNIYTKANAFAKKGYHFVGWSTEAEGPVVIKGEKITDEDHPCVYYNGYEKLAVSKEGGLKYKDTNLTTKQGEELTLYAQWAPCDNYAYTETVWTEVLNTTYEVPATETEAQYAAYGKAEGVVKFFGTSWYKPTVTKKYATTDTTVTAKVPEGIDLDPVNSTPELTIDLEANNYVDYCEETTPIANIDIVEKATVFFDKAHPGPGYLEPKAKNLTYNGQDQALVTEGQCDDGTVYYCVDPTGDPATWTWTTEVPTAKTVKRANDDPNGEVLDYNVWYKVEGDDSHDDMHPVPVPVKIKPIKIGVEWGKNVFNYDGAGHVPTATATGVLPGDTCYVYVRDAQVPMGNYTAEAYKLSNGNYTLKESETLRVTEELGTASTDVLPTKDFSIVGSILLAKATPKGSKKINVTWTGVSGATRYVIYAINCGKTTVYQYNGAFGAGTQTVTFSKIAGKKLKAHRSYKFYVQAFAGDTLIAQSNTMHCISAKTKGKKANPTAIYSNQGTIVIGANHIGGVSATVKVPKKKTILGIDHCVPYRYVTSDPGIATVDANGTVYGVHSGVCTVYTQTVNGMWCPTTVIVQ